MKGTIIATFGHRMRIGFADGGAADARIKGKALRPVCGDVVSVRPIEGENDWLVTAIDGRRNALTRPNQRGSTEILAANVDLLVVVAAASPAPDWFVIDRYLCAAELMPADAFVLYNKTDEPERRGAGAALDVYRRLAYTVLGTSVENNTGLDELRRSIGRRTAILVGQSGVGKSSVINRLSGPSEQRISPVSKTGEGRHTTVSSVMLPLEGGGAVIDSPGVRDYAPDFASAPDVERGFREVHAAAADCRFANCRHLREPDCAVKNAVDSGNIDARRYESYRRGVRLAERLGRRTH